MKIPFPPCRHDFSGEAVHISKDGEVYRDSKLPPKEEDKVKFLQDKNIVEGAISCTDCGEPYRPTNQHS